MDPIWITETFLVVEGIMEIMSLKELPWIDTHHCSSFLPRPVVMSTIFEDLYSSLLIDVLDYSNIIKIFQLRAPLSLHGFKIFYPPQVFPNFPLTLNPPFPRGHGGKALYEFYSIIWPSRRLLIMAMVKLQCSSVLIDYLSPSMDSLKNYYA